MKSPPQAPKDFKTPSKSGKRFCTGSCPMQRLMMRDDLVHALKAARCRAVLGQPPGLLNPWEKRLYDALAFDGAMTTEDIIAALSSG